MIESSNLQVDDRKIYAYANTYIGFEQDRIHNYHYRATPAL